MSDEMCKAERLAIAAAVAPSLRAAPEAVRTRRVAIVDKDGNVVGYRALADVQKEILKARAIELEVQDGERAKTKLCERCGNPFQQRGAGRESRLCVQCSSPTCADCVRVLPKRGNDRKSAKTPRCRPCYLRHSSNVVQHCSVCRSEITRDSRSRSGKCQRCFLDSKRPPEIPCKRCGKPLGKKSNLRARRGEGTGICAPCVQGNKKPRTPCATCGIPLGRSVMCPSSVAQRKGSPPRCRRCAFGGNRREAASDKRET